MGRTPCGQRSEAAGSEAAPWHPAEGLLSPWPLGDGHPGDAGPHTAGCSWEHPL